MCVAAWKLLIFLACVALQVGVQAAELAPAETLDFWVGEGTVPAGPVSLQPIGRTLLQDDELVIAHDGPISALAIEGRARIGSDGGCVRIVLVDEGLEEYLVAELYLLLVPEAQTDLHAVCRETCLLRPLRPHRLQVAVVDAELEIGAIVTLAAPGGVLPDLDVRKQRVRDAQEDAIVARLNRRIQQTGASWTAGATSLSGLPFRERKSRSQDGRVPVLFGFEYYTGGVFEAPGRRLPANGGAADVLRHFDWRERHGADRPGSPYFDGDREGGGWMTPVTDQACSDCWAHATTGMLEALVNLTLNRHLDVNLAEQELLSCSGGGDCGGGTIWATLDYVRRGGLGTEYCFPYQGADVPCTGRCADRDPFVVIDDLVPVELALGEPEIRRALQAYGPLTFGIRSWWHFMVLVGFEVDPSDHSTVWLVKNSLGPDWGENGYARIRESIGNIYGVYGAAGVRLFQGGHAVGAACLDADGDGYAAWGIGADRPAGCASLWLAADCDDSDPALGPAGPDNSCLALSPTGSEPTAPASGGGGGSAAGLVLLGLVMVLAVGRPGGAPTRGGPGL